MVHSVLLVLHVMIQSDQGMSDQRYDLLAAAAASAASVAC